MPPVQRTMADAVDLQAPLRNHPAFPQGCVRRVHRKPRPLPAGFPRRDWTHAELQLPHYDDNFASRFEVALASKKASVAWAKAQQTGDWRGAEDARWFTLAVADRAQER